MKRSGTIHTSKKNKERYKDLIGLDHKDDEETKIESDPNNDDFDNNK